jgi:hypothetical protein
MAETVITSCDDYTRALQYMVMHNGCDETKLDWTPNGRGWPIGSTWNNADYTGGNGTNQAGNGQCAMFDPRGGNMQFKPLPAAALATPKTGAYTSGPGTQQDGGVNEDAFAGYPVFRGDTCIT